MAQSGLDSRTETGIDARVRKLDLEQKVRLLTGADFWTLWPEPSVGLRALVLSDGPAGVRGQTWDERDRSANVPSPTALAATWDEALIERLGGLLAAEARRKGVDVLLAPTVNLHRTPYGGRHFECFSEDPLLTARIGVAYVRGVQAGGVAATVKHFVGNDSESERMTLNAEIGARALRELYLAPFEAIVRDGGVWAVMAAYNGVNGSPMTESPLLRQVLQEEWGFDGVTMSDWFAARETVASGRSGLDLVMPGPITPWGSELVEAVRAGSVPESVVDDKVLRLLRLGERVGALDGAVPPPAPVFTDAAVSGLLREAAAAGFVLLRNQHDVLPLRPEQLSQVAVLGPNAAAARTLGGGSATVFPPYVVSPLAGLRAGLGETVQVVHSVGVLAHSRIPVADPALLTDPDGAAGVLVRFLAADGTELAREQRVAGMFNWMTGFGPLVPAGVAALEISAVLRAPETGRYLLGVSGLGHFQLRLDPQSDPAFDVELVLPPGADIVEALMTPPQRAHPVDLEAGQVLAFTVHHDLMMPSGAGPIEIGPIVQLNLQTPHGTDDAEIARAVALATESDVAVVVVGTTEEVESEGFDRTSLRLPGRQDDLVRAVAAANPRTVVVVNAGAPVLMPWADQVAAVLLIWFPGQELGHALADVLLGLVEPGGRLPTSWPADERALPSPTPIDGQLRYDEDLFIGYRALDRDDRRPAYAFGHGLGYTTWQYQGMDATTGDDGSVTVTVGVRNSGPRPGRTVVQVYASRPDSQVSRPRRWLAGFATLDAAPGEESTVEVAVSARAFQHWDVEADGGGGWVTEPGTFTLLAGSAIDQLTLSTAVTVA
jgi:beta-glucosidase